MVFKRKRSPYYYYRFMRDGVAVYVNTKQKNKATAEEMEAAHRTKLAKGEAGLQRGKTPTLRSFQDQFVKAIEVRCAEKPRTVQFYKGMYKGLLGFQPLADTKLDRIDEALIERFIHYREPNVSRATVNRHLATLRRALRLADEWKIIGHVPRIRLLSGECNREFVLSQDRESVYIDACPDPLKDAAVLILETALRVGEALGLTWPDVALEPGDGKKFGYVQIRQGKSKNARRTVSLTPKAAEMLTRRKQETINHLVFPGKSLERPFLNSSLAHQHADVRDTLRLL